MSSIGKTLSKWYYTKREIERLEEKIKKYKLEIMKEMNKKETNTIASSGYSVTRRRTTRSTVSKENLPADLWNEYASKSHFDVYHVVKT